MANIFFNCYGLILSCRITAFISPVISLVTKTNPSLGVVLYNRSYSSRTMSGHILTELRPLGHRSNTNLVAATPEFMERQNDFFSAEVNHILYGSV